MTDPLDVHRYVGDEEWPPTFKTFAERIRAENAALRDELAERGPRQSRYSPDFSDIDGSHVFIQWKGTEVCLDFYCECGAYGHFDGDFAYAVRCGACGRAWALPHSVSVIPLPDPWGSADPVDVMVDEETESSRVRLTGYHVAAALAAADPVYDHMCCFFCGALAPTPPVNRGPTWTDDSEAHQDTCVWWSARRLLRLPPWPDEAKSAPPTLGEAGTT